MQQTASRRWIVPDSGKPVSGMAQTRWKAQLDAAERLLAHLERLIVQAKPGASTSTIVTRITRTRGLIAHLKAKRGGAKSAEE
jgi:hypothetical protein